MLTEQEILDATDWVCELEAARDKLERLRKRHRAKWQSEDFCALDDVDNAILFAIKAGRRSSHTDGSERFSPARKD